MTVRITVAGDVDAGVGDILPVLADVAAYPSWWPATRLLDPTDPVRIEVTPVPLVHIALESDDAWGGAVRLKYVDGPFRGFGTWTVRHGDSAGHSTVSYAVDLEPVGSIARAVATTNLFRRKHEYDVCRIIARLRSRVGGGRTSVGPVRGSGPGGRSRTTATRNMEVLMCVRLSRLHALLLTCGLTALGAACTEASTESRTPEVAAAGVDLGIADDEAYGRPVSWAMATPDGESEPEARLASSGPFSRPGVSIAWRNAQQIEEVEVRVRNLGSEPGEGRVWVDILDYEGRPLLHLEPPEDQKVIRVPAADRGGRDGKVLRMSASRELNNLIDRYDASRIVYHVQATVQTVGEDTNLFDNSKTKSWNIRYRVRPGQMNVYNYRFVNHGDSARSVRWEFETTDAPRGWSIEGVPDSNRAFRLAPGESVEGNLTMLAPAQLEEGDFLEARLSLVDVVSGSILSQREWFQVYDTEPPHVSNYRLVFTRDHRLALQALVSDRGSGVLEATGVTTEYSTDGGRTWSHRAHNYNAGNFTTPTLFEAVLGPFEPGTVVQLRFTARDTGGNVSSSIPDDAVGLIAPPGAEEMLAENYIYPRTLPNPIFELSSEEARPVALKRIDSPGADLLEMSTLEVVVR